MSAEIFETTSGRASVRQVTVVLPHTWKKNSPHCPNMQPLTSTAPPITSHIEITKSHPVMGDRPWTHQSQGCGQPGDKIQVGVNQLLVTSNENRLLSARLLTREWVKYRWGVFSEDGFSNDAVYPLFYPDSITRALRPNSCNLSPKQIVPFCKKINHVPEAPNKQNALCDGKNAWEVIMESEDFSSNR